MDELRFNASHILEDREMTSKTEHLSDGHRDQRGFKTDRPVGR